MADAVDRGLTIGGLARREIEKWHEAHAAHWPRYPIPGVGGEKKLVFIIDQFEPHVDELFRAVSKALK
jgi:hypothetical protein